MTKTATIRTTDQRLRVFVSSTLEEFAPERRAAREAITGLRLTPVFFEAGARPYPSRELYRAYLTQSDIFIGIYRQRYGRVLPTMDTSGLEDEYQLSEGKPRLIYMCGQCSRYVVISVIYHELSSGGSPTSRRKRVLARPKVYETEARTLWLEIRTSPDSIVFFASGHHHGWRSTRQRRALRGVGTARTLVRGRASGFQTAAL